MVQENPNQKPSRDTWQNFVKLITNRQYLEILKVLRRRTINAFRSILRITLRSLGVYYDSPWIRKRLVRRLLRKYYSWPKQDESGTSIRLALILRGGATYPYSSAFIRLLSPLTDVSISKKVSFRLYGANIVDVGKVDACIVQRTAFDSLAQAQKLVQNLHEKQTSLIIDTDDAFQLIDPNHPERNIHHPALEAFNFLVKNADQIWVSTDRLKSSFNVAKGQVIVIPNSLDDRLWQPSSQENLLPKPGSPLQILYMGTVSHDTDWDMIFPVLEQLANDKPGSFELSIVGVSRDRPERPWIKRLYQGRNGSIYPRFIEWYLKQGPFDIGLSPLVDSEFNLSKSDIKCLDYLAVGILPVVSDVEPYQTPELNDFVIRVSNTSEEWHRELSDLVDSVENLRNQKLSLIPKAQKYIWKERSSETTAKTLLKQLEFLKNERNT